MLFEMQPFTAFMNVESTRSYIDDLYSQDANKCLASIICIKNSVIGSNRQKESVIAQGIVPRLIYLLKDKSVKAAVRIEAAVTIGSLAKGTDDHIELLVNSGCLHILLDVLEENEPGLIDACLCCLRTLSQQQNSSSATKYSVKNLQKLLSFAGAKETLQRQSCVASILSSACKSPAEQNALCSVGAPAVLASLLSVQNYSVRIPVVTCLASMCWNNQIVASEIINTSCKDTKIPNYLATLISRDRPTEMQLEAARCLTNLHRAGAILPYDPIITYRTLPCLVRLCQVEHLEAHRAIAADTLAYLTEVDSNLQQVAAISNQLVSALVDLLKCPSIAARQAAFRAFASLGANDEDIRKRIIDTKCLMDRVVEGLGDENKEIRLAAVRCLHSLSRSVQQLRTTFQDHSVWRPLMTLLTDWRLPQTSSMNSSWFLDKSCVDVALYANVSPTITGGILKASSLDDCSLNSAIVKRTCPKDATCFGKTSASSATSTRDPSRNQEELMSCTFYSSFPGGDTCFRTIDASEDECTESTTDVIFLDSPCTELLTAASSALCNLLLEFSPAKEPMLQQGVVQLLATLTTQSDPSLRLNGVWALMNLAFQAEQRVKSQILTALGTDQIFRLLADSDTRVLMKTLGLLRNLVSPRTHTDTMMALHGPQVMQGVVLVLEGPHTPEVKEQALCILGNIADGERARDHIMSNEDVLKKLIDYMTHPAPCLQESAVFCINNLTRRGEPGAIERQTKLKDLGVVNILQQLLSTSDTILFNRVKTALAQFADI